VQRSPRLFSLDAEAGLDLDEVFGADKDVALIIDTNLDWKLYSPEDMTAFEKSVCRDDLVHYLHQLSKMQR
jgi:hypothetical protein